MRLDKYLADAGVGTRSEVKKYIKNKCITVDGVSAEKPEQKVEPGEHVVCFKGIPVEYEEFSYYLFHKPAGCVTARQDKRDQTVMDYFPANAGKNLSPVGRLDKDTEGLLLVTNDGELNHHLMSPAHHVEKTYYAVLDTEIPQEAVTLFANGVDIGDDKPTLPAKLTILSPSQPFDEAYTGIGGGHATLTISEGRFHQVKRMFAALGCTVVYLKRLSIGAMELGDVPRGTFRKLTTEEIERLRQL